MIDQDSAPMIQAMLDAQMQELFRQHKNGEAEIEYWRKRFLKDRVMEEAE